MDVDTIRRCERGHYYNAEKNKTCPKCEEEKNRNSLKFEMDNPNSIKSRVTVASAHYEKLYTDSRNSKNTVDEGHTVGIYNFENMEREPAVGWLVCIKGEEEGISFPLKVGRNFIGRGDDMDVVLRKDHAVSRNKHAIVLYEPKKRIFIAQPGESRSLVYLNDELLLSSKPLKTYDVLAVGETELSFMPFCGPKFSWEDWDEE